MGIKLCWGLAIGLSMSLFILHNDRSNLPFLVYPFLYIYGIGLAFGAQKILTMFSRTGGLGGNATIWLVLCMMFKRNGFLWGTILFIFYFSIVTTIGFWYGIYLFIKESIRYFTADKAARAQAKDNSLVKICVVFLLLAIGGVAWFYRDRLIFSRHQVALVDGSHAPQKFAQDPRAEREPQAVVPVIQQSQKAVPAVSPNAQNTPKQSFEIPHWKNTYTLKPATKEFREAVGRWQGFFTVNAAQRKADLEIRNNNGKVIAIFDFGGMGKDSGKHYGVFEMQCKYVPDNKLYYFTSSAWLQKAAPHNMVDMLGYIQNNIFFGKIINSDSHHIMGSFELKRAK